MSILRHNATTIQTNPNKLAKRQKIDHLAPITFGRIQTTLGHTKTLGIKILLDTGSTESHVKRTFVTKLRLQQDLAATWNTAAGQISTTEKCKLRFAGQNSFQQSRSNGRCMLALSKKSVTI